MNIRKAIDYGELYANLDKVVATEMPQMELYCEIGRLVSERTEKGAAVAAAEYLTAKHPESSGFSPRNLRRMRDFYKLYEQHSDLLRQAMRIGWTQNVVILEAELTMNARRWYLFAAEKFGWSKKELKNAIETSAHKEMNLDYSTDSCYNANNNEQSENKAHDEDTFYLPRQYPKKPRKSLLYQWLSSIRWRLLHHNYTICGRALM